MGDIIIYTDGGCRGNPGPGGWAYIIDTGGKNPGKIRNSGGEADTTNNKMELTAVIRALEAAYGKEELKTCSIILHTDSQYVRNGITSWIQNWVKNGWKTSARKPVKNREYWVRLKELDDTLKVKWVWVKGHAGNEGNEICDTLVNQEMDKLTG